MSDKHFLKAFIEPKSVAIVGVSRQTGKGAFNVAENLLNFGYKGTIYPINPNASEMLGLKVYQDIQSLPEKVDLAVVMTPRDVVPQIVERCAQKGIEGAIIITEGFGEADDKGKLLQDKIDDTVTRTGIRILGPNSVGAVNSFRGFTSAFIPLPKNPSPVALISQSGGFFEGFPDCPLGKGIDLGNTCDISFIDAISYFEKDPDIRVIILHMEGIVNVPQFMGICKRVSLSKPIIALKGGRSVSGGKAAASHTGSLSGRDDLYRAMFRQSGILQVDTIAGIGDAARALLHLPAFTGNRTAVITPTGAGGIITLDAIENHGFLPAVLSDETIKKIAHLFPSWTKTGNPLDILSAGITHGYKRVYTKVLESCLTDKYADIVIALCGPHTLKTLKPIAAKHPEKPLVLWIVGADQSLILEKTCLYNFLAYYRSPDRALYALRKAREHHKWKEWQKNKIHIERELNSNEKIF